MPRVSRRTSPKGCEPRPLLSSASPHRNSFPRRRRRALRLATMRRVAGAPIHRLGEQVAFAQPGQRALQRGPIVVLGSVWLSALKFVIVDVSPFELTRPRRVVRLVGRDGSCLTKHCRTGLTWRHAMSNAGGGITLPEHAFDPAQSPSRSPRTTIAPRAHSRPKALSSPSSVGPVRMSNRSGFKRRLHVLPVNRHRDRRARSRPRRQHGDRGRRPIVAQVIEKNPPNAVLLRHRIEVLRRRVARHLRADDVREVLGGRPRHRIGAAGQRRDHVQSLAAGRLAERLEPDLLQAIAHLERGLDRRR